MRHCRGIELLTGTVIAPHDFPYMLPDIIRDIEYAHVFLLQANHPALFEII